MGLADELTRLEELKARGVLTEDEFRRAKERVIDGRSAAPEGSAMSRLRRSRSDRWIGGVCGGIAAATGVESWIWRLVVAALFLFGGTGLLIYVLLWIFVPLE